MNSDEQSSALYINVGTVKSCLFVRMSSYLIRRLKQHPLLYDSVEEALKCAQIGYYGIGIIAFAQLLNLFNERTPDSRHLVGHKFLKLRPTKDGFDAVVAEFKNAAAERSEQECQKCATVGEYERKIEQEWKDFVKNLYEPTTRQ